ncbi:unnamed protein product [Albugo candida]|uniref:Uncharacterized protein n=1 Tax=Albugo candida TaxID=65357 RepID=A0A024FVE3_9STRA|nr:unnamed protein product [Albugo candida]|eukprot:CCI10976.1 unnamed protein product [Albugo candida]
MKKNDLNGSVISAGVILFILNSYTGEVTYVFIIATTSTNHINIAQISQSEKFSLWQLSHPYKMPQVVSAYTVTFAGNVSIRLNAIHLESNKKNFLQCNRSNSTHSLSNYIRRALHLGP